MSDSACTSPVFDKNPFNDLATEILELIIAYYMGFTSVLITEPEEYRRTFLPILQVKFSNIRLCCKSMNEAAQWYKNKIIQTPIIGPFNPLYTILTTRAVERFGMKGVHLPKRSSSPDSGQTTFWREILNTKVYREKLRFLKVQVDYPSDRGIWGRNIHKYAYSVANGADESLPMKYLLGTLVPQFRKLEEVNIDLLMTKNEVCCDLDWIEENLPLWEKNLRKLMPLVFQKTGMEKGWRFPRLTVTWRGRPLPRKQEKS